MIKSTYFHDIMIAWFSLKEIFILKPPFKMCPPECHSLADDYGSDGSALGSGSNPDAATFSVKKTPIYIFFETSRRNTGCFEV